MITIQKQESEDSNLRDVQLKIKVHCSLQSVSNQISNHAQKDKTFSLPDTRQPLIEMNKVEDYISEIKSTNLKLEIKEKKVNISEIQSGILNLKKVIKTLQKEIGETPRLKEMIKSLDLDPEIPIPDFESLVQGKLQNEKKIDAIE